MCGSPEEECGPVAFSDDKQIRTFEIKILDDVSLKRYHGEKISVRFRTVTGKREGDDLGRARSRSSCGDE